VRTCFFYVVAVVTAGLYRSLARRAREFATLYEVAGTITSTLRLEEVLDRIVTQTARVLGVKGCSLRLLEADEETLSLQASHGLSAEYNAVKASKVEPGEAEARALQGQDVLVGEGAEADRLPLPRDLVGEGVRSMLVTPLQTKEKAIGVFYVYSEKPGAFSPSVRELVRTLANQAAVAIENARLYEKIREGYFQTVRALALAIEAKDPPTLGHSERVTANLVRTCRVLGFSREELELISFGGLLHDIGRLGTGEARERLVYASEGERVIAEMHPLISRSILQPVRFLEPMLPMIVYHHERYDGSGYPEGLAGEQIPLLAQVLAVADAYDILTSEMSERGLALSAEEAIAYLREKSGTLFAPRAVEAFCEGLQRPPEPVVARLLGIPLESRMSRD